MELEEAEKRLEEIDFVGEYITDTCSHLIDCGICGATTNEESVSVLSIYFPNYSGHYLDNGGFVCEDCVENIEDESELKEIVAFFKMTS